MKNYIVFSSEKKCSPEWIDRWMGGSMEGWVGVKAFFYGLLTALKNLFTQNIKIKIYYSISKCTFELNNHRNRREKLL